jgi:hypothetical protein
MKAITIWQPYASLIALGLKRFETRGWGTSYRGPLVIHAAKKWDEDRAYDCERVVELLGDQTFTPASFNDEQNRLFYTPTNETLGKALGVVQLVECRQMDDGGSYFENEVGSFGEGRFGWECDRPRIFETPIAAQGKQGLWIPEASLEQAAKSLLEGVTS